MIDPRILTAVDALITEDEPDLEAAIAPLRAMLLTAKGTDAYDGLFTQLAQLAVELGRAGHRAAEQALVGTLLGVDELRAVGSRSMAMLGREVPLRAVPGSRAGGGALLALRASRSRQGA